MPKKSTTSSKNKKPVKKKPTQKTKKVQAPTKAALGNDNHIIIGESTDERARWYVVHTYSGHENKVATALKQRVESMELQDYILEVLIPTQNKIKISKGKKLEQTEKIFPGYILIKMIMNDKAWLTVRTTSGITSFIGIGSKPTPISDKEVEAIQKFMKQDAPKYQATFRVGEGVKIVEGPFADFLGNVESIDEAKGKVKVLVSIFGRETPVELDFLQVANI